MQVDVGYSTHVRQVKFSSSRIPYPSAQESETRICTSSSLTILHLPLDHLVAYNINFHKLQCLSETSVDFFTRPCLFSAKTAFVDFILSTFSSLVCTFTLQSWSEISGNNFFARPRLFSVGVETIAFVDTPFCLVVLFPCLAVFYRPTVWGLVFRLFFKPAFFYSFVCFCFFIHFVYYFFQIIFVRRCCYDL